MNIKDYEYNYIIINDELYYKVDIGKWYKYEFADDEQYQLQIDNIIDTNLYNNLDTSIKFIYTRIISNTLRNIYKLIEKIDIIDTETMIVNEVYYTNKIEGAESSLQRSFDIHNGISIDKSNKSEIMISNGFKATKLMQLYNNRIDSSILYKVWSVLVKDVCDNLSIKGTLYRNGQVYISDFIPPNYKDLPNLMEHFYEFYNSEYMNESPIIKAIILHYMFETIHPFCDGNGRLGRMLMNNYLISQNIDIYKAISISKFIDINREKYYSAFRDAENTRNDCTPFIECMLDIIYESLVNAYKMQNKGDK